MIATRITAMLALCIGLLYGTSAQAQENITQRNRGFVSQREDGMIKQTPARHLFADSLLNKKAEAVNDSITNVEANLTDSASCECCCKARFEYIRRERYHHRKERAPRERRRGFERRNR